jgi:hypothetical protein
MRQIKALTSKHRVADEFGQTRVLFCKKHGESRRITDVPRPIIVAVETLTYHMHHMDTHRFSTKSSNWVTYVHHMRYSLKRFSIY